ncbi:hypothetical protein [Rhodanobacter sp. BL-MT-08]
MNHEKTIRLTPPDQVLCIFHGNCADGFGAAWVVHRFFGDGATFHAGHYGQPPPDCTGKVVFIVDFSYPRDVLIAMAKQAQCIVVLDHHKTAAENLHGELADNIAVVFDMEHSGAALTWSYFYPEQHAPRLLKHIEDRDLWRFALPHTREIQAALFSYPYDFAVWNTLMLESYDSTERLQHDGIAIERKHHKDIGELLAVTRRTMTIGGIDVPTANLPYTMSSEACHIMATDAPFAACYWDTPDGRVFSLRSREDGADVSAIAKQYGGGGHQHASGFRVPYGHELAQDRSSVERFEWRVVANAGRLSTQAQQRWAHVMDATALGSQSSIELCHRHGFDPDEVIGGVGSDE